MIKKIILAFFLITSIFGGINYSFAGTSSDLNDANSELNQANKDYQLQQLQDTKNNMQESLDKGPAKEEILDENYDLSESIGNQMESLDNIQKEIDKLKADGAKEGGTKENVQNAEEKTQVAKDNYDNSSESKDDLSSIGFQISVGEFTKGLQPKEGFTTEQNINFLLGTIIQKLMIALGVLSVLIMTVGGGYIIMFHGQDELLSKGKSIFMSGIIALVVALSSYYIVSGLRFILYNNIN